MKLASLRRELEARGLPAKGRKAELEARLSAARAEEAARKTFAEDAPAVLAAFTPDFDDAEDSDVAVVVVEEIEPAAEGGAPAAAAARSPHRRTTLHAHRFVLSRRSAYFRGAFSEGFTEADEPRIEVRGFSAAAFTKLLSFCYTGRVELGPGDAWELLAAADRYGVPALRGFAVDYLASLLDADNALEMLGRAEAHGAPALAAKARAFACERGSAVLASSAVLELPAEALLSLLRDDALRASELEAFEAVLRWGAAHREGGASLKAAVAPFLPHLRFEHVPPQELQDVVRKSGVVPDSMVADAALAQLGTKKRKAADDGDGGEEAPPRKRRRS